MHNSEESNTQQVALQCVGKRCHTDWVVGISTNNVKLYSCVLPSFDLYQWSDLDLHILRLFMEELPANQSEGSSDNTSIEVTNLDSGKPPCEFSISDATSSMNSLLFIFIRYLQLIMYIPWSSPMSITHGQTETWKNKRTNALLQQNSKSKKPKHNHRKQPFEPGLCGLVNIGNTCFMNSAIQCLSNIPQLTEWAAKLQSSECDDSVTQAYISLIQSMWSGKNACVNPHKVKKRVSQHAPIFADYAQKDSHEFMNSLLNALHLEFEANHSSEEQSSIVTDLFHIRTESAVTCSRCNICDPIEETTYCLPLPLADEPTVSLKTLLNDFVKEEQLDGQYYCSHCQDLRQAKQKTSICLPLPPVIIVQLKRFTFDETNDKLNTFVEYPIVDWKVHDDDQSLYDLLAISMHVGNLKRGHYTTYARLNASEQWYHFNDSCFTLIDDTDRLVNRDAYILIYLKKN